jgi:hypothetical protein
MRSPAAWAVAAASAGFGIGFGFLSACASQSPAASAPPASPAATPTPVPTPRPPVPAARVPDQPYVGTPRPVELPYIEIMRLKNRGATNEELLAKVQRENVAYSLSTYDIQRLRASGISEEVIAAMLSSGREGRTATPSPVPASKPVSASTPTPTPRGS